jgi:hypothetical protein
MQLRRNQNGSIVPELESSTFTAENTLYRNSVNRNIGRLYLRVFAKDVATASSQWLGRIVC